MTNTRNERFLNWFLARSTKVLCNVLQAFGVARQMLSLVAGSAIDEYLLSQLRQLRQPHTLARIIHALQNKLWPGGIWFQHTDKYMQQHPVSPLNSSQMWPGKHGTPHIRAINKLLLGPMYRVRVHFSVLRMFVFMSVCSLARDCTYTELQL